MTILIQRGTLKVGDDVVAGAHWGRVRAMHDYKGDKVKQRPARRARRDPRLRLRARGRRVRARRRERPHRAPARGREGPPHQDRVAGPPRRQEVLARGHLRPRARRARQRAQPRAQGRRLRLARGLPGRDRQAAAGRGHGVGHLLRRRRHHGVRRHPRGRLRRDHPRLQRAPRRRGPPARRPRGRRDPRLLGHLPRDRRAARRHAGHARPRGGRGDRRHRSRCARPSAPRRSAPSPAATSPTARSTRGAKVRLVRDGTIVYDGEIASLRRFNDDVREVAPASSAASCSRTTWTSRKAT